jgi:hypothetical protein
MADDVHMGRVAAAATAVAATVAAVIGGVLVALHLASLLPQPAPPPQAAVPGPALQTAPQPELVRLRAQQRQRLEGVGWIDRERRIAYIPIEDAMALMAARAAAPPARASEAGR